MTDKISFDTSPREYRHWRLEFQESVANLFLKVNPLEGLRDDYSLKLNSYDLGVDVELYDAVQRLRFEHPEVKVVVLSSDLEKVFSAGANIQMLAGSTHHHKVNFCKFTNETRNSIEDATADSSQTWIAALNGTAAGGGYELALACDEIVLVDDRSSTVSLPEVPLLAVLPGTGGLTRVVDKRHVRRDLADVFATKAEGVKGSQALKWGLVDHVVAKSLLWEYVGGRASERAKGSDRPSDEKGVEFGRLERRESAEGLTYPHLRVTFDRTLGAAFFVIHVPKEQGQMNLDRLRADGSAYWFLELTRELDDAVLRLRFNEPELGTWVIETDGDPETILDNDEFLRCNKDNWLVREILSFWRRTMNRVELSARTVVALVEPQSCFAGSLAEFVLLADRSYMLENQAHDQHISDNSNLVLSELNNGYYKMINGISRLESRFYGRQSELDAVRAVIGEKLSPSLCEELGLVTFVFDDIDFKDEIRIVLEERASYSPDALSGLEANCRFVGPETMESKIFSRLTAWQNWIFQRQNAVGPQGALASYGTGSRPDFTRERI